MNRLTAEHGALLVGAVDGATLDAFTAAAWGTRAPATWNRHVATLRSFTAFARRRGWMTVDPAGVLKRRTEPADRTKAIAASSLERHSLTSHGLGQAHALAAGFAGRRLSTSRHHDWLQREPAVTTARAFDAAAWCPRGGAAARGAHVSRVRGSSGVPARLEVPATAPA